MGCISSCIVAVHVLYDFGKDSINMTQHGILHKLLHSMDEYADSVKFCHPSYLDRHLGFDS